MSNSNSEEATASSEDRALQDYKNSLSSLSIPISPTLQLQAQPMAKRKRSQPGNPALQDPDAEVIALSPNTLIATYRFVCEICNKGFQRNQNLQLHRRGHNLPWKLRQRSNKELIKKKVYVCPEVSCVHHQPSRALGDLTGIKKHYSRKHGEKKWKCEKCSKRYAVHSDWKAHVKTCGTREYRCDCGILFAWKDSFITHRAFCDALAQESARALIAASTPFSSSPWDPLNPNFNLKPNPLMFQVTKSENPLINPYNINLNPPSPPLSATALLQKASIMKPSTSAGCHTDRLVGPMCGSGMDGGYLDTWQTGDRLIRDFLGVTASEEEEELIPPFANFGFGLSSPADDEYP